MFRLGGIHKYGPIAGSQISVSVYSANHFVYVNASLMTGGLFLVFRAPLFLFFFLRSPVFAVLKFFRSTWSAAVVVGKPS